MIAKVFSNCGCCFRAARSDQGRLIAGCSYHNAARQAAIKAGDAKVGDGKDIGHKKALDNGGGNEKGNTQVQDRKTNRGWRKGESGYKVGTAK